MTAEVALINRYAIVLAADSALTVGNGKIYNQANKLFELSKHQPVGVMVYGNASHQGIPWETLIKSFRSQLGDKSFATIDEYADEFFSFLEQPSVSSTETGDQLVLNITVDLAVQIMAGIGDPAKSQFRHDFVNEINSLKRIIDEDVKFEYRELPEKKDFMQRFREPSEKLFNEIFDGYKISQSNHKLALELVYDCVTRAVSTDYLTGVVFAGYGEEELLPSLSLYLVQDYVMGKLLVAETQRKKSQSMTGSITSFAQSDVATLFMEGLSEQNRAFYDGSVEVMLNKFADEMFRTLGTVTANGNPIVSRRILQDKASAISNDFIAEANRFRHENRIKPIVKVISNLPKEEMATLAEALVDLTSIRRKISDSDETVGGPVDVAIISKGDGFIWYKRKHYFDPELNPSFFERRAT